MAAKKKRTTTRTQIVRVGAPAKAPVINIRTPKAIAAPRGKRKGHRRGRGGGGGLSVSMLGATALGGAALGFVEKQWPNAPTLPLLGRAGTIALAAYWFGGKSKPGLMRDIAIAGAVVAGYELGKTGKIAGDDVDGELAPQVGGVAAQV